VPTNIHPSRQGFIARRWHRHQRAWRWRADIQLRASWRISFHGGQGDHFFSPSGLPEERRQPPVWSGAEPRPAEHGFGTFSAWKNAHDGNKLFKVWEHGKS